MSMTSAFIQLDLAVFRSNSGQLHQIQLLAFLLGLLMAIQHHVDDNINIP